MKKTIIFAVTHFSVICNGIEIPHKVVQAIGQVEGGTVGKAVKEKNGRYSYGRYQISAAFLTDVNKYYDFEYKYSTKDMRDKPMIAENVVALGLAMIMSKRKCDLVTALAVYNGGWKKRNTKQCSDYAERVMAIAKEKE
jgi:hypothetical protein